MGPHDHVFAVVMGVGWAISFYYNNPGILLFAVVFAIVMNVTSYWFSDKIVVKMAGQSQPRDKSTQSLTVLSRI